MISVDCKNLLQFPEDRQTRVEMQRVAEAHALGVMSALLFETLTEYYGFGDFDYADMED